MDTTDNPIFHDQYTFVHFMDGLFFYLLITHFFNLGFVKGFILWFILHLIYELKDLYFSYIKPVPPNEIILYGLISNNSWQNTISDTIYSSLGFILGHLILINFKNYKFIINSSAILFFIILHFVYYIAYF